MGNATPATIIIPGISIKETIGTVSHIEIEYVGDIYSDGVFQQKIRLGSAFLNLINSSSIYQTNHYNFSYKELSTGMVLNLTEFENFIDAVRRGSHKISGKIAILDQIEIIREHRGRKLFKGFMWLLLKAMKEQFEVDYVFLKAAPYGFDVNDRQLFLTQKSRLEKLYFTNGFRKYQTKSQIKTNEGGGYVINYLYIKLAEHDYSHYQS